MKNYILTTIKLNNPFDPQIWNQYMINAYYKYCLEKFVLPQIYRVDNQTIQQQRLDLIGPISSVNQAKEKYDLMSEIERQRNLVDTQISESIGKLSKSRSKVSKNASDSYNIILNCCSDDKILLQNLADRLISEGYLVLIDYCDKTPSNSMSKIHKTDLIIICFSFNYSQNVNCMTTMVSVNQSEKKIIPVILLKSSLYEKDNWLQMTTTEELFYESFGKKIKFKLKENLDLDYDRLLKELVRIL